MDILQLSESMQRLKLEDPVPEDLKTVLSSIREELRTLDTRIREGLRTLDTEKRHWRNKLKQRSNRKLRFQRIL